MKFVTVRDLRGRSAEIWRELAVEHELVVTSNGKPIAILTATSEDTFEQSLREVRRARALHAVSQLQQRSVQQGRDDISDKEIDGEIAEVRAARRR
jgi:antitoxin (DNA-binding transcriptional repressor) of toxin-antitoxin stability system